MRKKHTFAVVARMRGQTAYREIATAEDEETAIDRAVTLRHGYEFVTVIDRTDDPQPLMHYRNFDLAPAGESLTLTPREDGASNAA